MSGNGFMSEYMGVVSALADTAITQHNAQRTMEYQNDYNSPKNQIARMHAAGLSPWSYQGQGNTSAQPVYSPSNISGAVSSAVQNRIAERQVDVQENLSQAQKMKEESQAKVNDTLARTNEVLLRYLPESERQRIRAMSIGSDYTEKQTARYDEQVNENINTQKSQQALNYANSDRAKADVNRIKQLLPLETRKMIADTKETYANIGVLKTQADLNNSQIANVISMFIKNMEESDKIGLENWMLSYQKEIIKKTGIKPGTPPWTALTDMFARIRHDLGTPKSDRGSW